MLLLKTGKEVPVPSIKAIQEILVRIGDKERSFIGSRGWIGGAETCYVIDELFQVPCYLHHISSSERLSSKREEIVNYFKDQGGLIAMGGDQDAASKLVAGVHIADDSMSLLIVVSCIASVIFWVSTLLSLFQDPHFAGVPKDSADLVNRAYVKWQPEDDFIDNSFYNLCLPKLK